VPKKRVKMNWSLEKRAIFGVKIIAFYIFFDKKSAIFEGLKTTYLWSCGLTDDV
jgi:hypothetical protein